MKKLHKWLAIGSVIFVFIYLGAIMISIKSQNEKAKDRPEVIEPARAYEEERHLILPELLLPMGILLCLAFSYLIVKRRNAKTYDRLDDKVTKRE